ncbi:MAG: hypothetical protein HY721_31405 [Planctomycetes bacterium]|nr:hypothetical protein [Planctomycetota bacterium]
MRSLRLRSGIHLMFLLGLLLGSGGGLSRATSPGADFLRGDSNGDGVVSAADVHRILGFLFQGFPPPDCMGSADVDDSGVVDYLDAHDLWNYLRGIGQPPPRTPFPEIGPDVTPAGDLGCESYGGGAPLEDPAAKIQVLDVASRGGPEAKVTLRIAISSSRPAAGFSLKLRFGGTEIRTILGSRDLGSATSGDDYGNEWKSVHANLQSGALGSLDVLLLRARVPSLEDTPWIPPGNGVVVLEIDGCLLPRTPAGEYPILIEAAEIIDAESGWAIRPALGNGLLTVDAYVTGGCDEPNAVVTLGGGRAPPGGSVVVPFVIRCVEPVEGYSFSVDFDEEVLRGEEVEVVWRRPDGEPYDFQWYEINDDSGTPGSHGVDEGFIVGVSVFDFQLGALAEMPADTDNVALRFHFRVRSETTARGTEVIFLDGGRARERQPTNNAVSAGSRTIGLDPTSSFLMVNGFIAVIDDIATFIRGDSNGDRALDVSDAVTTLGFLFLGKGPPSCFDAADYDDDGTLAMADPIGALNFLFLSGKPPAPPFPAPGGDPTPDGMTCLTR